MFKIITKVPKRLISALLALLLLCTTILPNFGDTVIVFATSSQLVDGTSVTSPSKGTSYYFDFINDKELSNAAAGEYGLLSLSSGIQANSHGAAFYSNTSLTIKLYESSKISIGYCAYDTEGTKFTVSAENGSVSSLPEFPQKLSEPCYTSSGKMYSFDYTADQDGEQTITIHFSGTYYIPYLLVEPLSEEKAEEEEASKTYPDENTIYLYDFSDQPEEVVVPTTYNKNNPVDTITSSDGFLTIYGDKTMYHNGDKHGLAVKNGNRFEITVAGNASISFALCEYANNGTIEVSYDKDKGIVSKDSISLKAASDGEVEEIIYKGEAATLTFTITGSGYVHGITVENTTADVDVTQWKKKDFSFMVKDTLVTVAGAEKETELATATSNAGTVYYANSTNAYVSLPLNGINLKSSHIADCSDDTVESYLVNKDGDIVVTFKDQTTYPYTYTVKVQDTYNFETPGVMDSYEFDFLEGAVPTQLNSTQPIEDTFTTDNGILTIGIGNGKKGPYFHDNSHGIIVNNNNYFDIKVATDATITFTLCGYSANSTISVSNLAENGSGVFSSTSLKGSKCNDTITYTYTGDATTLRFTVSGTSQTYLHKISVKNNGYIPDSEVSNEQLCMPYTIEAGNLFTIRNYGQKLEATHSDSSASITDLNNIGYYVFDATNEGVTLEADIKISEIKNSSGSGVFVGAFDSTNPICSIATVGVRGDGKIRNIYHKVDSYVTSAGGLNMTYTANDTIHVKLCKDSKGISTEVTIGETTNNYSLKYTSTELFENFSTKTRFGFAFSNVCATITNITYKTNDGVVLYSQSDCYDPVGTAPVVNEVDTPVLSDDRTTLSVSWSGDNCKDDAAYKVELSKDGGNTFTMLDPLATVKSYSVMVADDGAYQFKITGVCGSEIGNSMTSDVINVKAPLASTTLSADGGDLKIDLSWTAVTGADSYEIYRRSSDEIEYSVIADITDLSFCDMDVINETPYYYYVVAKSSDNYSNPSNVLLALSSGGHTGDYVYEDEAAQIILTNKSDDTVFVNTANITGFSDRNGKLVLRVNDELQYEEAILAGEEFSLNAVLADGRNDVTLYLTDEYGNITRKTYNYVYLSNYDIIVDSAYVGIDGDCLDNSQIPVYKTIQAAVNSVPANNTERTVIFIKEGSYTEHLVISSPYISLIGQDRELVNINFYDSVESPAGGDTDKRCSVYVTKTATGFSAENLTMENTYEYLGDGTISNESADALKVDANQSVFVNVALLGYQDTLDASSNYQYYYKCYITGNIDYIYGSAQALFEDCDLVYRYSATKNAGYITAPKTDSTASYGYIFNNCRIYGEDDCNGSKYLLARPWGPDGAAAFINCYMSELVNTAKPYADMGGNLFTNARFVEYFNYGPGFDINNNRTQISKGQAENMLTVTALGWDPYSTAALLSSSSYIGDEAVLVPTPEPTPEVTTEPTLEPIPEVTTEPTLEPIPEVTTEPTPEPAPEATTEPTPLVTAAPTLAPTPLVTAAPTAKPTLTPTQAPITVGQPKSLGTSAKTGKTATIRWEKVNDASGYVITYKNAEGNTITTTVSASTTSITLSGLLPNKTYSASVKAYKKVSNKTYYGKAVTIKATTNKIAAVSKINATKITSESMVLSWKQSSEADGYVIVYKNALGAKTKITISSVTKTKTTISKLLANKYYDFSIAAYAKIGNKTYYSNYTKLIAKTEKAAKPSAAKISSLRKASKTSATVSLTKLNNVKGYEVAYSLNKSYGYKTIDLKKNTKQTIKKLNGKKTYYVKVRAYTTQYKVVNNKLVTKKVYGSYSKVMTISMASK